MKWILALLIAFPALAGQEGRGGDSYVWDFKHTAQDIVFWLANNESRLRLPFTSRQFQEALASATLVSTIDPDQVRVDGEVKEAVTFPKQNKIVIYRPLYDLIHTDRQKWLIVLHEGMHLLAKDNPALDDKDYTHSSQVVRYRFPKLLRPQDLYGAMAHCSQLHLLKGSGGAVRILETRNNKQGKVDLYFVRRFYPSSSSTSGMEEQELKLAQNMTCKYSTTKVGLMECRENWASSGFSEFWITVSHFSRPDWTYEKISQMAYVTSPLVEKVIQSGKFALIDDETGLSRDDEPSSEEFRERLKKDILPIFTEDLSWKTARLFDRVGAKAFGGTFKLPRAQCAFLKPEVVPASQP